MPRSSRKQPLSQVATQAVQRLRSLESGKKAFKNGARIPRLRIRDEADSPRKSYPLVGDRYVIGRSSRLSDILLQNPIVSQAHCSLHRDSRSRKRFWIQDEGSTNGIYRNKTRLKSAYLRHGDVISLGPPELRDAPQLTFVNPPPLFLRLLRSGFLGLGLLSLLIMGLLAWEWRKIPVKPWPLGITGPVVVYSGDGKTPLNPVKQEVHREFEHLQDFSTYLPQAVIASEDTRFYWHPGVDPYGIARAILVNRQAKGLKQGASTVTQQLARSLFSEVGRENSAGRKIREILVALKLEMVYSKDEILKTYLNRVYLGAGNYGFEDAAQFYFDKSARVLDISEAATLVAMLPAPNLYNPVQDYQTSVALRNRIIERMSYLGMISETEANRARRSRITVSPKATKALAQLQAPYFYSYIFTELRQLLGEDVAQEGNFIVESTLDLNSQKKAEKMLKDNVASKGKAFNYQQGALVTLNSRTGEILALVGGTDYQKSQYNRVTQALRQPGSTFKLFPYTAAIEAGVLPYQDLYSCEPLSWRGQNYRGCERTSGEVTLSQGLALSENVIALRVAQQVGLQKVVDLANKMGISSRLQAVPGLVLGQSEVRLLDITGAYGAIAAGGKWQRPHAIRRIRDGSDCQQADRWQTCREIYNAEVEGVWQRQVVSPQTAQTLVMLLREAVEGGTGQAASIGYGAAGKTGTTNEAVDLLFIGMVPSHNRVTGIWLGNDDNKPTTGSSALAAELWGKYTLSILN